MKPHIDKLKKETMSKQELKYRDAICTAALKNTNWWDAGEITDQAIAEMKKKKLLAA